jgi:hypothetical protein
VYTATFFDGSTQYTSLSKSVTYNTFVLAPLVTKVGYTFDGWYTASNFSGTRYIGNTTFLWRFQTPVKFYAKFVANQYNTVYYYGTSQLTSYIYIDYNSIYTFISEIPNPGYTFNGWYDNSNLSGTIYLAGSTITWTFTENKIFYAKYSASSYSLTYSLNGGTLTGQPSSVIYNSIYSIPSPTKSHYTFNGWYIDSGLTTSIASSGTWTLTSNQILYAKYTGNLYSLTYSLDGGTLTGQPSSVNYNSVYSIPSPTKTNYTFNGWYIDSDLTTSIASSGTWTITSNQTLYAKFTLSAYDLIYNTNGIGGITSKTYSAVIFGSTPIIPIPKAVGYTFNGWYDSATGGTKKINNDGSGGYTMPGAVTTLYAQWTPLPNIRFSYLQNTYGNINNDGNKISLSEYQSSISKQSLSRTALSADFRGKGPDI